MTGPFKMVEDESVIDEVEKEQEEIMRGVNVGVFGRIKSVEETVIKGVDRDTIVVIKGLTKLMLLFLFTKKSDKHSSDNNSNILDALR